MRLPRKKATAGFGLVELLIAATVLCVGIAGILMTNTAARALLRTSEETRGATLAAQEALEAMDLLRTDEIVATFPGGAAVPTTEFGLRDLAVVPTYPDYVVGDGTVYVLLTVTWTAFDGGERTLTFETVES